MASGSHGGHSTAARQRARVPAVAADVAGGKAVTPATGQLSTLGLPLGRPQLTLAGLGEPQEDPVTIALRHPPRSGLLFNLQTGRVLWQWHPELRMPIASLTKMMTALVVVSSTMPGTSAKVTRAAVNAPGSRVGVLPLGKRVPVESLLYGLLLPSGNDAADALAEHVAGTQHRFVVQMNVQAAALGLGCTQYSNPSGYFNAGNFSCAADLAELAHADLAQPRISRVVRSATATVPFPIKGGKLYLSNNNPLLVYGYRGANGLKTGYTEAAGKCLVATATRRGVTLGVVLLNSPAPGTQAQQLLDAGFQDVYGQQAVAEAEIPGGV